MIFNSDAFIKKITILLKNFSHTIPRKYYYRMADTTTLKTYVKKFYQMFFVSHKNQEHSLERNISFENFSNQVLKNIITNMRISLGFVAFLVSVLIAEVICSRPPQDETSAVIGNNPQDSGVQAIEPSELEKTEEENSDSDQEEEEEEDGPGMPFLTCVVFNDDTACNAMCSIIGSIYGEPITSGSCDADRNCNCNLAPNATLDDFWKLKFISKVIPREIRKDKGLAEKVFNILKTPFRTPRQTKQDLAQVLSPKQLKNLRANDSNTKTLFDADGLPKVTDIEKYVANKLGSLETPLESRDYIKSLAKVLATVDKQTFDLILHLIRRSQNELLNRLVDEYVKEHDIEEHRLTVDDQDALIDILDTVIINETIKKPYRASIDEEWFDDNTNTNEEARWTLNGIDENEVAKLKTGHRCWEKPAFYKVCLTRTKHLESLTWFNKKGSTLIEMQKSSNGEINQDWLFRNGEVRLNRRANGAIKQEWSFANSRWEYSKSKSSSRQEWDGREDWNSVEKYKKIIESWCAINGFYLGKKNCIIY